MMAPKLARGARAAAVVFTMAMFTGLASAEEPTPAAVAVAKELIVLKGSTQLWDAVVPGVIEQVKAVFMQTNPALGKELNDVAAQLRTEYAPRASQLVDQVAQLYARTFTEQELKRSEEHTSELQSLAYLVCRLLLEKKKTQMEEKK